MAGKRVVLGFILLGGFIVVLGNSRVNCSLVREGQSARAWSDGSPMPLPEPKKGLLVADGSPMPLPEPKKQVLVADGSPMPLPEPKKGVLVAVSMNV